MNKMNKKGFTLIEMLVVIAIIAVLVAIIIPTVSSATTKAKAAADAANLRAAVAEGTVDYLGDKNNTDGMVHFTKATNGAGGTIAASTDATAIPKCKTDAGWDFEVTYDLSLQQVVATFGGHTIEEFATAAETGTPIS